jgi:UDP-N-acetylglucosamine--N-acetylmuramyl-(pentapeptide) pyrophosphoryl-undecaprenol N-acetylglucosamine transferase
MNIAVACGGTGGHVFPGIAAARALTKRGHVVTLWLAGAEAEADSVHGWDGAVEGVRAAGFRTGVSPASVAAAWRLLAAVFICRRRMRRNRPDAVLGMGSYACFGPVLAARSLGVPVVLHEANAIPGRAVRLLAPLARAVAVAFAAAAEHLPRAKTVVTGFPLRPDLGGRFEDGLLAPGLFTVLVMGGSQGAQRLNEIATAAIIGLHQQGGRIQVVHLSGRRDDERVRTAYATAGVPHLVFSFLGEMGQAYSAADLAISRAGAASCTELAACGVPSLLVPFPWARGDHQAANAREMARAGGADVMLQQDLTVERLTEHLRRCLAEPERLARMRSALKTAAVADGAERLADLVERAAGGAAVAVPDGRR